MNTDLQTVLRNERVAPDICRLVVTGGQAEPVQPGQFHMLRVEAAEPLLPRPLSIHDVDGDELSFLYEVKGAGTKAIAALREGDRIRVTGPLGHGFDIADWDGRVLLVAGGIGIAPFRYVARALRQAGRDAVTLAVGFRSEPYGIADFDGLVDDVRIATEDGSAGVEGRVPVLFDPSDFDVVAACGPVPMMRAVKDVCRPAGTRTIVSMEARMACGVGACLGCTIPTTDGNRRCCADGPVFDAEEVMFDELS